MALYALGDLHLSFQSDKSMDKFGKVWRHHDRKIEKYVRQIVKPEDTLVLTGDHSWGRKLADCREDLAFIERFPGRKILLRGNHDMFWDAKKTERLNEEYRGKLFFLQNNFAVYQDYALVGTKGRAGKKTGGKRDGPPAKFFFTGPRGRVQEIYHVSALPAHQHTGANLAIYRDCTGVQCNSGCVLSLSRGEPLRGQYPGRFPGGPVHAGVGRLPAFSSGGSTAVKSAEKYPVEKAGLY